MSVQTWQERLKVMEMLKKKLPIVAPFLSGIFRVWQNAKYIETHIASLLRMKLYATRKEQGKMCEGGVSLCITTLDIPPVFGSVDLGFKLKNREYPCTFSVKKYFY